MGYRENGELKQSERMICDLIEHRGGEEINLLCLKVASWEARILFHKLFRNFQICSSSNTECDHLNISSNIFTYTQTHIQTHTRSPSFKPLPCQTTAAASA